MVIEHLSGRPIFGGEHGTSVLITGDALPSAVWRDSLEQVLVEAVLDLLDGSVRQGTSYA